MTANIGIKHGFPCINVCQVPREMMKTEAEGRGFQQLPRDLANVNALENNVWSLLLHKFNHNAEKITKNGRALFSTSSQLPCWFLHALSISIKILVSGHGRLSLFFQPLAELHKFKSFSLTFSFSVACSVIFFTISESALLLRKLFCRYLQLQTWRFFCIDGVLPWILHMKSQIPMH